MVPTDYHEGISASDTSHFSELVRLDAIAYMEAP